MNHPLVSTGWGWRGKRPRGEGLTPWIFLQCWEQSGKGWHFQAIHQLMWNHSQDGNQNKGIITGWTYDIQLILYPYPGEITSTENYSSPWEQLLRSRPRSVQLLWWQNQTFRLTNYHQTHAWVPFTYTNIKVIYWDCSIKNYQLCNKLYTVYFFSGFTLLVSLRRIIHVPIILALWLVT